MQRLQALQDSVRQAWRLLIVNADDGSNLLELPVGQLRCLRRIMENEGCKLIDLARETNLSLPNASRLVDRLVQRGFVMRETDPADRRAVRLYISEQARAMIEQIDGKRVEHLRHMTEQLSSEQIDGVVKQLRVVIETAERMQASDPKPALDLRDVALGDVETEGQF